jgi:predicted RNase H-like nuclease (RuvC/YqgF family)
MKKNSVIEALSYENFILKTKYNEMVQYATKIENELKKMKEKYSNDSPETQIRIISILQTKNAQLNKEINDKNKELTQLINEPFVLLDTESHKSGHPLFHISKYKTCPSSIKPDHDTMSEITEE